MAGLGQALMARDKSKAMRGYNSDLRSADNQARKRSAYGGVGRGLLSMLGGALTTGIGMPWLGAGIGSALGSKLGSSVAGKHKDIKDQDFYTDQISDAQSRQSDLKSGEGQAQLARGVRDAFGAYMAPEIFGKIGGKLGIGQKLPPAPELEKVVGGTGFGEIPVPVELTKAGVPPISGVPESLSAVKPPITGTNISSSAYDEALTYANSPAAQRGLELGGDGTATGGSSFGGEGQTFMAGNEQINLPTIREANSARAFPRGSADAFQGAVMPFQGTAQQNSLLSQALGFDPNRSLVDQLKRAGQGWSKSDRANMFADLQRTGMIPYR